MHLSFQLLAIALMMGPAGGPSEVEAEARDGSADSKTVVVWISLDGWRSDYLDRGASPFLNELAEQGASSRALIPAFPSLTFPSHVSQATGVGVERHGIPSNSFYDDETGLFHRYPGDAALLEAEPIWLTAARQGLRVASLDWTLSHNQLGPIRTAYFDPAFDGKLSDAERLNRLIALLRADESDQPLQLLMGYGSGLDKAGHSFGPDAPEVDEAIRETDALLSRFHANLLEFWRARMSPDDRLILLITTDHGMSAVSTMVDLDRLAGVERAPGVVRMSSGNLGHIFFTERNDPERESKIDDVIERVNGYDFARAFRRGRLPQAWQYRHPTRVGDVVVVLDKGFAFSGRGFESADAHVTAPVEVVGGPLGMHGYDPVTNPEMLGSAIIWRFPEPIGGLDLGPVHSLQLHATVARMLGIEPAEGARPDAIDLPGLE
ncbi:nucleotide pyrophosphatase/phosphodiesterase family protein [Tautonia sp. JC769]|uniref:alkaline phosphatase family protein n=1 Tax=Tautonia sp. JC769 TaxID=3232135 RepID=UPI0034587FA9